MSLLSERLSRESDKTLTRVSRKTGVHVDRLMALGRGEEPSVDELRRLAKHYNVSISDLVIASDLEPAAMLFRQNLARRPGYEDAVERLSQYLVHSVELLAGPTRGLEWLIGFPPLTSAEDIPRAAVVFRDRAFDGDQVSPLLDLPERVEHLGVFLFVTPNVSVDGASALFHGQAFVFIAPRFQGRMLFTLAHEVGHLVEHQAQGTPHFGTFDTEADIGRIKGRGRKEERIADAFASCVLMPEGGVATALKSIRRALGVDHDKLGDIEILYLARIFGVGFEVAGRRCEDLDLLPRGGARALYDKLCEDHGSPEKRAEEVGVPPRPKIEFPIVPRVLLESAVQCVRDGKLSIGRASSMLTLSIASLMDAHARP